LTHAHFLAEAPEVGDNVDYLKQLYPHEKDGDCWMDEVAHAYYIRGEKYPFSVSSVWKVFFPQFDTSMPANCLKSAASRGLRCLDVSAFNLAQHLLYVEKTDPFSSAGADRIAKAVRGAERWYDERGRRAPFDTESLSLIISALCLHSPMVKPAGTSCYFLSYCLGLTAEDVQQQWKINGDLESFKGTFLHKQAELYMQALAAQQVHSLRSRIPLGTLMAEQDTVQAARAAAGPRNVMRLIATHTSQDLWDHPSMQEFLTRQMSGPWSIEFQKFEAWLSSHPELTPFRSEWSIFHEQERLAGQIDSLWLDTTRDHKLVMADWKRAKHRLETDPVKQKIQAYQGARGLVKCASSELPGPCQHLYNVDYNHYFAQQNLYAYFLECRYGLLVDRVFLVQCHPEVGATSEDFHEAPVAYDSTFAEQMVVAFRGGWKKLLAPACGD